jgi:hypothetical protein
MIFTGDSVLATLAAFFATFAAAILVTRLGCSHGGAAFSWLITLVVAVNDNKVEVILVEFLLRTGNCLGTSWLAVLHFTLPAPKAARGIPEGEGIAVKARNFGQRSPNPRPHTLQEASVQLISSRLEKKGAYHFQTSNIKHRYVRFSQVLTCHNLIRARRP